VYLGHVIGGVELKVDSNNIESISRCPICKISKMASKIDPASLNGLNYPIWAPDMETLLKRKGLWHYTKLIILDPKDDQMKFVINGKKYEDVGVTTTYISHDIHFHTSGIVSPHEVSKKLKYLIDKVDESQVIK
jgi:hypothetical protein